VPEGEVKEPVKKGGDNTVKYLLGAIGVLLFVLVMLFVIKQVSQSTYRNQIQEGGQATQLQDMTDEAEAVEAGAPPIDIMGKTDLTVGTKDGKMCVMKFVVIVSRADIAPVVSGNITRIINEMLRLVISKQGDVLVEEFSSGAFNKEIVDVLNTLLEGDFAAMKGFMDKVPGLGDKTERKVIRVDIVKFQVVGE